RDNERRRSAAPWRTKGHKDVIPSEARDLLLADARSRSCPIWSRARCSRALLLISPHKKQIPRRYAPRDDNRSLSGFVRVQAIPSLLQHGAFDAHREDRRRHPEIPRRTQIWNEVLQKRREVSIVMSW